VAETRYAYDQSWEHERARLAGIESLWESGTRDLLAPLAQAGSRCLEVGAGGGATVAWLAERTGPDGVVLATDIDTRFVEPLASSTVEVLQHDITTGPPRDAAFDVVHARLVLEHLPAHEAALANMVAALRPGGWLVVEDYDWTGFGADPPDALSDRIVRGVLGFMSAAGFDPVFGRRLLSTVGRQDVEELRGEGRMVVIDDRAAGFAFFRLSFAALRDGAVAGGRMDAEDADAFAARLEAGGLRFLTPVLIAAVARRRA
jgi:SAM-dependent methyltransferase